MSKKQRLACSSLNCSATFPPGDVLFECLNYADGKSWSCEHPYTGQPANLGNRTIFRPKKWSPSGTVCPFCGTPTNVMRCPTEGCFALLPAGIEQSATIAVVGARTSGKTCFITGLLRQIKKELGRDDQHQMSLEFMDDGGKQYFRNIYDSIFEHNRLPPASQAGTPISMYATIRFPLTRWSRRLLTGDQADIPLVFPDPAGELFDNLEKNITMLSYLSNARGLILAVDPLADTTYRKRLKAAGKPVPTYTTKTAYDALTTLVRVLRAFNNQQKGRLDKSLAVVVTKCDEPEVFDPDDEIDTYPNQGRKYDVKLAEKLSKRVERYLRDDLELPEIGSLARRSFKNVAFFAASALGTPPVNGKLPNPEPRRVEEPLLWILHQWGLL